MENITIYKERRNIYNGGLNIRIGSIFRKIKKTK